MRFALLAICLICILIGGVSADITAPGDVVGGIPNDADGPANEASSRTIDADTNNSAIVISEFMTSNETTVATMTGGQTIYPDWIEILNTQRNLVSLDGWYLTDDPDDLTKWAFPAIELASGESLLLFASGVQEENHPNNWPFVDQIGYYHVNFKLDRDGGYLALVGPDLQVAHEYGSAEGKTYPVLEPDTSYGLYEGQERYYAQPSPGVANDAGFAGISAEPVFSHPAGMYSSRVFLELSSPNPTAQIRYTIDGSVPNETSTPYTNAIALVGTTEVIARVYEPDKAPSPPVSRMYMFIENDLNSFNSDVPIVLIDTQRSSIGSSTYRRVRVAFIDVSEDGRAGVFDPVEFIGRGGLKTRGSSTGGAAKHQFAFEIWDENDRDMDVSLLGLPADSDWVLYAPYTYDRALINNALAYELSNQVGRYAPRTRFFELYLNTNNNTFSQSDYHGLYILTEKIKRGPDRVDVEKLEPWIDSEPAIGGGYMLKIDRSDPGDSGFSTGRQRVHHVDPKEDEITPTQLTWLRNYFSEFEDVLYGPNFAHPEFGYAQYIDVDSWIDHNLLNMIFFNVDAFRLSGYFHKDRGGKIVMGPLWDFDRAMESTDGRDDNPRTWGSSFLDYIWWRQLFEDANFWQAYIDRWYRLRRGPFSTAGMNATVDAMADEIREAQARNYARWSSRGPRFGGFQGEIDHLKDWVQERSEWVDSQFVAPPTILPYGGEISQSTSVTIFNQHGNGIVYYTLDGSDPRLPVYNETLLDADTLVAEDAVKHVLVPNGPVDDAWRQDLDFNTAGWVAGAGGVGYERSSGYDPYFDIDVEEQMYGLLTSCYIRIPFVFDGDRSQYDFMRLLIRYDDGFVAYLNGIEIARALFSGTPTWNSHASSTHGDSAAVSFEEFDVTAFMGLLQPGRNLLAIHGLNANTTSSDFLIGARLAAGEGAEPTDSEISETAQVYTEPIVITQSTQIKARVVVASNPYSPWSGLAEPIFSVGPIAQSLRISEVMYHPADFGDPNDPNTEYIELTNIGDDAIDLKLVKFINGVDFAFGPTTLAPGDYTLVVKDVAAFESKYGQGLPIAGQYDGSLANSGERIVLHNAAGQTIHDFSFEDGWYAMTDGSDFSLTVIDPATVDANALAEKASWRPSAYPGGSPGYDDGLEIPQQGAVVINELMANPNPGQRDWIELYNTTDQSIDIGGWFLSDDADRPTRYEIDADVTIDPGGYVLFYQDEHFSFGLSRNGETVYLHSGRDGIVTGYIQQENFGVSEEGVSMGRHPQSTGAHDFLPLVAPTPGATNAEPKVGPIVISEIMYNWPLSTEIEYVELLNISPTAVSFYDAEKDAPWRFTNDPENPTIEFLFPSDDPVVLEPGQCLLLVRDLHAFEKMFHIGNDIPVFEWINGRLADGTEKIQLSKPGDQNNDGTLSWMRVDRVVYSDGSRDDDFPAGSDPWPVEADGQGFSLHRIVPGAYGNDPINWHAITASPGLAN